MCKMADRQRQDQLSLSGQTVLHAAYAACGEELENAGEVMNLLKWVRVYTLENPDSDPSDMSDMEGSCHSFS